MGSESVGSACGLDRVRTRLFQEEEVEVTSGHTPIKEPPRGLQYFNRKHEGHFAQDFPLLLDANNNKRSPGPSSRPAVATQADRPVYPELQCPCGRGPCLVRMSRTIKNPDRYFYTCPAPMKEKCRQFKWCDEVDRNQQLGFGSLIELNHERGLSSPVKQQCDAKTPTKTCQQNYVAAESSYPICACRAGKCRLLTMENGVNAGRKYFACTIKKGQGACNYFQWLDSPVKRGKEIYLGTNKISTPEKPMTLETDNGAGYCHLDEIAPPSFFLADVPRSAGIDGGEATSSYKPEPVLIDVSRIAETTPVSPKRVHEPGEVGLSSPLKRLNLQDGSPGASRPGKCYRCGGEGHWMKECNQLHRTPCFKCGRFDHWKSNCTA